MIRFILAALSLLGFATAICAQQSSPSRAKYNSLRVTVDGKEAYLGKTQPSLGYCTLQLKPTQAKIVRITVVGAIEDKGAFDMTEITGKRLDAAEPRGSRGTLDITEAEIYEPLVASAQ